VTLSQALEEVLKYQRSWTAIKTPDMEARGRLIRNTIPELLSESASASGYKVEGSAGAGSNNRVPWVRIFHPKLSPKPTEGWYAVFLFAADASAVFLSLNQGTTSWANGRGTPKEHVEITGRRDEARGVLLDRGRPIEALLPEIVLGDPGQLGRSYEAGNVYALRYEAGKIPVDTQLGIDLARVLALLQDLYSSDDGGQPLPAPTLDLALTPYTEQDALGEIFIDETVLGDILSLLRRRKNVVLQGPPGVGKTFMAKHIAYALIGRKDDSQITWVQFHQSYSYEDFIQGYRPSAAGHFTLKSGLFYNFCKQAGQNRELPFVFIIDEINRGNLSRIFGETLSLIEADKRDSLKVTLAYSEVSASHPVNSESDAGEKFTIPANVYLIGLMNTADRSLAVVDYALRRRFGFVNLRPCFSSPKFQAALTAKNVTPAIIERITTRVSALNERIRADKRNLGEGFEIGHSFFCPMESVSDEEHWYQTVIDYEIKPLLQEYWFDDPDKAAREVSRLAGEDPG
jgi:hypothetical protein